MHLLNCPLDLYLFLRTFLSRGSRFDCYFLKNLSKSRSVGDEKAWRNLTSTCKSLLELRRKTILLFLQTSDAFRFLQNESFRTQIQNQIEDPCKQLHFRITSIDLMHTDHLFHWNDCHEISFVDIHNRFDVSCFSIISVLNLTNCEVTVISNLASLKQLTVLDCHELTVIDNLPSVHGLVVEYCPSLHTISNVPSLQRIRLKQCYSLSTLSIPPVEELGIVELFQQSPVTHQLIALAQHYLTLHCNDLEVREEQFPNLHHLTTLLIAGAKFAFELSSMHLQRVRDLRIMNCSSLVLSDFPLLQTLYLTNCDNPQIDFKSFPALKQLAITECSRLTSLDLSKNENTVVERMKWVCIFDCPDLQTIAIDREISLVGINGAVVPEIIISHDTLLQVMMINGVMYRV